MKHHLLVMAMLSSLKFVFLFVFFILLFLHQYSLIYILFDTFLSLIWQIVEFVLYFFSLLNNHIHSLLHIITLIIILRIDVSSLSCLHSFTLFYSYHPLTLHLCVLSSLLLYFLLFYSIIL